MALAPRVLAAEAPKSATDWEQLRKGGYVFLMRHTSTTVAGADGRGYKLGDCSTQLALSDEGRAEAIRIGERLKDERIPISKVYTSPFCRCKDTAMLAFGKAEDWEPLRTFFYEPDKEADLTQRVKQRIAEVLHAAHVAGTQDLARPRRWRHDFLPRIGLTGPISRSPGS